MNRHIMFVLKQYEYHMTFMSKQCAQHLCLNNMNKQMIPMYMPYEPIKNRFCMTIIAKWSLWC